MGKLLSRFHIPSSILYKDLLTYSLLTLLKDHSVSKLCLWLYIDFVVNDTRIVDFVFRTVKLVCRSVPVLPVKPPP